MKKTTAKGKINKVKGREALVVKDVDLVELTPEDAPVVAELDPEILKVFVKPKKAKNIVDTTDYIPELERGDADEDPASGAGSF
jgi:hypothetical protein